MVLLNLNLFLSSSELALECSLNGKVLIFDQQLGNGKRKKELLFVMFTKHCVFISLVNCQLLYRSYEELTQKVIYELYYKL